MANNTKTYNLDVLDTLDGVNKGSYVYTFYATDKDATLGTAGITITATGPDQLDALHQDLLATGHVTMVL